MLAFVIFLGVLGVVNGSITFWIFFTGEEEVTESAYSGIDLVWHPTILPHILVIFMDKIPIPYFCNNHDNLTFCLKTNFTVFIVY